MSELLVSVIMPVFNAELFLADAIKSVLDQTFGDFEFIIVNDGSTDNSQSIIESFLTDKRIIQLNLPENKGNCFAANKGIEMARGKYIIRMDADDLSVKERFRKQVDFMENNPDIGYSGSDIKLFGNENAVWTYERSWPEIRCAAIFGVTCVQGSSIIRKEVLDRFSIRYDEAGNYAEDLRFYYKLFKHSKAANIPEVLLLYRRHGNNVTTSMGSKAEIENRNVFRMMLSDFGINATDEEMNYHFWLNCRYLDGFTPDKLKKVNEWKERLKSVNEKTKWAEPVVFNNYLEKKWRRLFYFCADKGKDYYKEYKKIDKITFRQRIYFYKNQFKNRK